MTSYIDDTLHGILRIAVSERKYICTLLTTLSPGIAVHLHELRAYCICQIIAGSTPMNVHNKNKRFSLNIETIRLRSNWMQHTVDPI